MSGLVSKVAAIVGISPQACRRIADSAYRRYKQFEIPKRSGRGMRLVAQPAKEVKAIQRALVQVLEPLLPVHASAMAYRRGVSIRDNAELHARAAFLTKLDFEGFFPSIGAGTVARHLRAHVEDITDAEVKFVLNACLWRPEGPQCLCIGAPSSPLLSNSVMHEFDIAATELCGRLGVVYSRYSDDISLSTNFPGILALVETSIRRLCEESEHPVLRINERKRVAVGRGAALRVTGLTLANDGRVTVGRERKRGVRAGAERYVRGQLDPARVEVLKGEIAFVLSVEPDFRDVLERTYGERISYLLPRRRIGAEG